MDLLLSFIQGTLEMMGLLAVGLSLARVPLKWKVIIISGIVIAAITFLIRALPFTIGIHTIVALLCIVLIIIKLTEISSPKSFLVVLLSFIVLASLELVIHEPFFAITGLDAKEIMSDELMWPLLGLPQAIIMNLIAIIISKFNKPISGVWKI